MNTFFIFTNEYQNRNYKIYKGIIQIIITGKFGRFRKSFITEQICGKTAQMK